MEFKKKTVILPTHNQMNGHKSNIDDAIKIGFYFLLFISIGIGCMINC